MRMRENENEEMRMEIDEEMRRIEEWKEEE